MFHLVVSLSLILTVVMLSLTDGENHWRASIRCVSGQSCYDHWCRFIASGASYQRGKGTVDITGAQLDFALVCVFMHVFANL